MKFKLAAVAASTGLAASAFFGAVPAGAQAEPLPLTVTPTSGSDAIFDVSGTGCISEETGPGVIDVFIDGTPLVNDDPNNPDLADEEGNWVIGVSPSGETPPPGVLQITATCTVNDGTGTEIVTYAPATYEIVAAPVPTTAPEAPAPAPEPATPVVAEPTFTG